MSANTAIIGSSPAPASSGLSPRIFWKNCGRNSSAAKKTADIISVVMQAARKPGLANTSRGISAHEPARRSITANATSSSAQSREQAEDARVAPAPVGDLVERDQQRDEPDG